jgi:hypothetical protein
MVCFGDPELGPFPDRRFFGHLRRRFFVRPQLDDGFGFHQPRLELLAEPVALPLNVNGGGVMEQPIQNRRRDDRIAKHLALGPEALIARQDDCPSFIAVVEVRGD